MVNDDNDQYATTGSVDDGVDLILQKLPSINPMTTSNKEIIKNIKEIMNDLDNLNEGVLSDHASDIHAIHESINEALKSI